MKKWILAIFFISVLSSCATSWDGRFYGMYGYYKHAKKENPSLFYKLDSNQNHNSFSNKDYKNKVIVSNGIALRQYISKSENSIVYIWNPKCRSYLCIPLEIIQNQCNSKKIDLFVVARYYDAQLMSVNYNLSNNIIGIDTEYYKSGLTKKYLSKFLYDLGGYKDDSKNYLFFKNGVYQGSYISINEINL